MIAPANDAGCGWLHRLPPRRPCPPVRGEHRADWVVIGAGYSGLSAARALAQHFPQQRIILLDAARAGEGASARNSGYLVDSTLNDGHLSDTGLRAYRQKYELNLLALKSVERLVREQQLDCDWNACGKYHASAGAGNLAKLRGFGEVLAELDIAHEWLQDEDLQRRLGTAYYRYAVYTRGGVLLQPAALARGMIETLPATVELFENTLVRGWQKSAPSGGVGYRIDCERGRIQTGGVIVAVNGFMPTLGLQRARVFPLVLTASMTRALTAEEYASIGQPPEWGVLSASAMGASLRWTADRRLLIRNTAEVWPGLRMDEAQLRKRRQRHQQGLQRRFPQLSADLIESTWSGITCISANNANVFASLDPGFFAVGCYNGGGIGLATLFGEQIALRAAGGTSEVMALIQARPTPKRLPPQPVLNWGVRLRLARDRWLSRKEA